MIIEAVMTPDLEIWAVTDDWSLSEQIVRHGVCTLTVHILLLHHKYACFGC